MKINKNSLYEIVLKLNILLTLSAIVLIAFLSLKMFKPIERTPLNAGNFKIKPFVLADQSAILKGVAAFDEAIFKKRELFSQSAKKKAGKAKKEFLLLGVSVGQKKLAMIRDTKENKDYYCAEGDIIVGLKVKQIFKDRVILESESRTIEISQ